MLNPTSLAQGAVLAVNGLPRWARELLPSGGSDQAAANNVDYIVWLEARAHIVYPLLGAGVLGLMAWAILSSLRSSELDSTTRVQMKTDIMDELRMNVGGLSTDVLAKKVGHAPIKVMAVLEEMSKDNQVWSTRNSERLTVWHARGVGNSSAHDR
ncbi:MAG: hypothetical protein RL653_405 [Pseudomonadota bacterium]|jgi:hypothetical protein